MQSGRGARPGGLVAVEFQEWLRCRAIPAICAFCMANFKEHGHPPWFSWSKYQQLCAAMDRAPSGMEPLYLLSLDADARHTMNDLWAQIDNPPAPGEKPPPLVDRRDIPPGQPGHIPLHPIYNYVPSAPRIPDVLQFPIESTFSSVKRVFRAELKKIRAQERKPTTAEMVKAIERGFEVGARQESIERRFDHAEKNMLVFSGREGTTVEIDGVTYHCTGGNWLPKVLRA